VHSRICTTQYARHSCEERRSILEKALREHHLTLRADSSLCNGWINGRVSHSLMHVVAIMDNTKYLFDYSHIAFSNYHDELNADTDEIKFSRNVSWIDAADLAQDALDISQVEDYSDDMIECWNCGGLLIVKFILCYSKYTTTGYGHMSYNCYDRHRY
jgi:hypothetical protein